jgi:hypothetical protein
LYNVHPGGTSKSKGPAPGTISVVCDKSGDSKPGLTKEILAARALKPEQMVVEVTRSNPTNLLRE